MTRTAAPANDFRRAQICDLGGKARKALKPAIPILGTLLAGLALYQFITAKPGCFALLMTGAGACFALSLWSKKGVGLPLMPMIVLQHLVIYGLPLIVNHDTVTAYSEECITQAGVELLIFLVVLGLSWSAGITLIRPLRPVCYGLLEFNRDGSKKLRAIGFSLILATLAYQIFERTGYLSMLLTFLPSGAFPVVWGIVSAAGTCGFFICALLLGGGSLNAGQKGIFWLLLFANCYIEASSFLLSSALVMVITVIIGLFWSTGRVPWRYLAIVLVIFSFLNIGKAVMRERYWGGEGADSIPEFTLGEMPDRYMEWVQTSIDCIGQSDTPAPPGAEFGYVPASNQSLLDRINNIQNLLFVIDAVQDHHYPLLYGKTYTIIPALLIPRILWPNKPGTHEGQVMLNVHFGRQDLLSTSTTYVAWGLLPEAYGNFGPIAGSVFLGAVLGVLFAWIERFTEKKLVISVEGFVSFVVFLMMANSFEFVAGVLVTSIEQAIIPIVAATAPFARRTVIRPEARQA